jgi:hypothetical protein
MSAAGPSQSANSAPLGAANEVSVGAFDERRNRRTAICRKIYGP